VEERGKRQSDVMCCVVHLLSPAGSGGEGSGEAMRHPLHHDGGSTLLWWGMFMRSSRTDGIWLFFLFYIVMVVVTRRREG
jgi:hypothetical protein